MLDLIALKIRRSRYCSPIFGDRVTVVADVSRATTYTALAWPAAYVMFSGETAAAQEAGSNDNWQRITQQYDVIVGLEATADVRGQHPALRIEDVRRALFRAIYNWTPGKEWGALWYRDLELIAGEINRAVTFWRLGFACYVDVCGDDGETEEQFEPLPDFIGANIKVDWIDPHDPGLPPSQEYDPRRGPPPWPTGPEGRIEMEFQVDLPLPPTQPLPPPPLPRGKPK
jgi:hypothetical protein